MFEEPKPPTREEYRRITATFDSLDEAVGFVRSFWMAVDPESAGPRVATKEPNQMTELTYGIDRTALSLRPSALHGGKYGVVVYANSDSSPLSEHAVAFLRREGYLNT